MCSENKAINTKLVVIPTELRLEVPVDMSTEDITKLVKLLSVGDSAVYPDDSKGSLLNEVTDHITSRDDYSSQIKSTTSQISMADLWTTSETFNIINF